MVGSTTYYLHQDALGNTRLETTTTVTVKFSSNYVPYGKNYAMSGREVFMYTGKPYDSATGLYYFGARFYDPTTGRFTIQDSITGVQEDPMSLNRYIYGRDNPERYTDPNGHRPLVDGYLAVGGGGGTNIPTTVVVVAPGPVSGHGASTGNAATDEPPGFGVRGATAPTSNPGNPAGAYLATALVGTLTLACALGAVAAIVAAPFSLGTSLVVAGILGYGFAAGLDATESMVEYDIEKGPNANPSGAFAAGGSSFLVSLAEQALSALGNLGNAYGFNSLWSL